jgi:release factor glutamine methyltransferase
VRFVEGDLLAGVDGPLDLIVSNPPYVGAEELDALEPEVRDWEPRGALVDEGQTLRLARDAQSVLAGWLVLEVHEERAQAMSDALAQLGFEGISIRLDLAGKERVLEARWQSRGTSNGS